MGWNGTHPKMTKAEARARLHPAPCKRCVYVMRVFDKSMEYCPRCGVGTPDPSDRDRLLRWA
jgi:ribosomal protein L37E